MEKKLYIKPSIKPVCMLIQSHLASESVKQTSNNSSYWAGREQSIWEEQEEEEEDNLGGWFK